MDYHSVLMLKIERVNAKLHTEGIGRREGDVVWKVSMAGGRELYVLLLLEFQSRPDRWMAVRLLVYVGLLYQHLIREKRLLEGRLLPPVLPFVLYNGHRPWRAPETLDALIAAPKGSKLWAWQPRMRYYLLDESAWTQENLERRKSLVAVLFRLETCRRPEDLHEIVSDLIEPRHIVII